jgi:hypothetical protein
MATLAEKLIDQVTLDEALSRDEKYNVTQVKGKAKQYSLPIKKVGKFHFLLRIDDSGLLDRLDRFFGERLGMDVGFGVKDHNLPLGMWQKLANKGWNDDNTLYIDIRSG